MRYFLAGEGGSMTTPGVSDHGSGFDVVNAPDISVTAGTGRPIDPLGVEDQPVDADRDFAADAAPGETRWSVPDVTAREYQSSTGSASSWASESPSGVVPPAGDTGLTWPLATAGTPPGAGTGAPAGGQPSTTDVAKEQGAAVAGDAKHAAQHVAGVAKDQAQEVVGEARDQLRRLAGQTRDELTDQAGQQQERLAAGLKSLASELRSMAQSSTEPGVATNLVREAADRAQSFSGWLDQRDPGSVLDEVRSYARRRPGMFITVAFGAGILAGRLVRGLASDEVSTPGRSSTDTWRAATPPPQRTETYGAGWVPTDSYGSPGGELR